MPIRRLPVRPQAAELQQEADRLLRAMRDAEPDAIAELREFHPGPIEPAATTISDAQLVVARSYEADSWQRLMEAVRLAAAIWADDIGSVRALVSETQELLFEPVLIRTDSNWGPPLTYAAHLGRDEIIRVLYGLGARDLEPAANGAALQGQIGTARMLYEMAGRPELHLAGPAYTLSAAGTAFMLAVGGRVKDDAGRRLAPVDVVLETDGRNPEAKHAILEMYAHHGLELPDTPVMALHRGRIDLLERHLERDPGLLSQTFSHREIYPAGMGCQDPIDATVGTPLDGTTLLHLCVDYGELQIGRWLLDRGMDVNVCAAVGRSGFGGYTALFNTVVSQPNFWMNYGKRGPFAAPFTELLLERGADPNVRASLWKRLHPGHGDTARHEYRDVTAISWGRRFHAPIFVSEPAIRLIAAAGGVE